ncbi:hypothetical protein DFA_07477 [Cavenderia fasciculata]|uniref:Uncharacterized protein n=1 Tax=Cavenderia fasciculata TaxID=261658 RepID=F4PWI9_CACFS|nr:uncharacterized protein DFA_07477 [Cavenderia fasciculata]EGG20353.1 hypothetical protein DFA_07477 [Cavenderia fasciculata]|eukprot:XP_004367336.1 hypothetical protein DFA_07477 [Cavenderia fasciculata]
MSDPNTDNIKQRLDKIKSLALGDKLKESDIADLLQEIGVPSGQVDVKSLLKDNYDSKYRLLDLIHTTGVPGLAKCDHGDLERILLETTDSSPQGIMDQIKQFEARYPDLYTPALCQNIVTNYLNKWGSPRPDQQ